MRKPVLVVVGLVVAWNLLTLVRTWQAKRAMVRLQPKPTLRARPPLTPRRTEPTLPDRTPLEAAAGS